jgi:hypothetical protein
MTIAVVDLTRDDLIRRRRELLASLRMSQEELRNRAEREIATADERAALAGLEEIAFLLGEGE